MGFSYDDLKRNCDSFGLALADDAIERFNIYSRLLTEWNEKINLTAIVDPDGIRLKHFFDCLLLFKNCEVTSGAKVIDVGTGAGFPGMVMKIVRPDIELTLLDGLNKRIVFLETLAKELGLNATCVHARAEEGGNNPDLRESFDVATARAVARLNVLAEYCLPFVRPGGSFIALKGPAADEEIKGAYTAIKTLGGDKAQIFTENLCSKGERKIVFIKKISQTPTQYPRCSAKISKKPL